MKNLFNNNNLKRNNSHHEIPPNVLDNIKKSEATNVLKEYISHFAYYNIDVSMSIDIIVDFSTKYDLEKEKVSLFISLLNSNLFSIRTKKLIPPIDINNLYFSREFRKYNIFNDNTTSIITYSMKYLKGQEHIDILLLNKSYAKRLTRILYKNLLRKYHYMGNKNRLKIWGIILKIVKFNKSGRC
jgi:hypothetical protein